jgi:hypothetical protein
VRAVETYHPQRLTISRLPQSLFHQQLVEPVHALGVQWRVWVAGIVNQLVVATDLVATVEQLL